MDNIKIQTSNNHQFNFIADLIVKRAMYFQIIIAINSYIRNRRQINVGDFYVSIYIYIYGCLISRIIVMCQLHFQVNINLTHY